jgi:hypothetical protein
MTSRRRMPMASSWKLSTTLRRKKSLGSMLAQDLAAVSIAALGPGSTKAQHDPLIVPGKRQA